MTIQVTKCPPRAAKGAMRLEGAIGGARRGRPATIPVNGRRAYQAPAPERPGGKPLSRMLDGACQICGGWHKGTCREEAERKQREREAKA